MIGFYNYTVIPTYIGLSSAVVGIFLAFKGNIPYSIFCLMLSGFCDMLDGTFARKFDCIKPRSSQAQRFGIHLDSLSDVVCFGVLPAVIGYSLGLQKIYYIPILVVYVLCALIRLAYFNVSEEDRQNETKEKRKYYEGLPVTAAALFIPLIFCFSKLLPSSFPMIYCAVLLLHAAAFIINFKVKKPGNVGMLIMLLIGICTTIVLIAGYF